MTFSPMSLTEVASGMEALGPAWETSVDLQTPTRIPQHKYHVFGVWMSTLLWLSFQRMTDSHVKLCTPCCFSFIFFERSGGVAVGLAS